MHKHVCTSSRSCFETADKAKPFPNPFQDKQRITLIHIYQFCLIMSYLLFCPFSMGWISTWLFIYKFLHSLWVSCSHHKFTPNLAIAIGGEKTWKVFVAILSSLLWFLWPPRNWKLMDRKQKTPTWKMIFMVEKPQLSWIQETMKVSWTTALIT